MRMALAHIVSIAIVRLHVVVQAVRGITMGVNRRRGGNGRIWTGTRSTGLWKPS